MSSEGSNINGDCSPLTPKLMNADIDKCNDNIVDCLDIVAELSGKLLGQQTDVEQLKPKLQDDSISAKIDFNKDMSLEVMNILKDILNRV